MVFRKKEVTKAASQPVVREQPPSVISADLHIIGDLEGGGTIQVLGRIEGNIRCEKLIVGDTGQVEGKVTVNLLELMGKITGSVRAGAVRMMKTGRMVGDVLHEEMEIEAGALLNGFYKRLKSMDSEQRGDRFKDVSPPERSKKLFSRTQVRDETPAAPVPNKETPAKAIH